MPPLPKTAATRQRRNKSSTHTKLMPVEAGEVEAPPLPATYPWHPLTLDWWRDLWRSPMAPEYEDSDIHGLLILAALVDQFWQDPSPKLAGEIRLQRQCFGLSPIDRRRLQWEIDRGEAAEESRSRRQAENRPRPTVDPRSTLSA